jgi:threonyl-tRNA synthetase
VAKKVRDAELSRAPYMLVAGDREQSGGTVSVRSHEEGELGSLDLDQFAARLVAEASSR